MYECSTVFYSLSLANPWHTHRSSMLIGGADGGTDAGPNRIRITRLTTHIAHAHTLPKQRTVIQHLGEFSLIQVHFLHFSMKLKNHDLRARLYVGIECLIRNRCWHDSKHLKDSQRYIERQRKSHIKKVRKVLKEKWTNPHSSH